MSRFGSLLRALRFCGVVSLLATPLFGCQAIFGDYQINDAAFAGEILLSAVKPDQQTTEWRSQVTFTMALDHRPTADVTITLSSSDPSEGSVSPEKVIFTKDDWKAPQVITVTGENDDERDGNQTYTIITAPATSSDSAFAGKNPSDVELVNIDNETAGITVVPKSGLVTSESGVQDTFTVVLNSPPEKNVNVSLTSDTPSEGTVSPDSLLFTPLNWMAPQQVTVTGVDDDGITDPAHAYFVTVAATSDDPNYAQLDPIKVGVINQDNESAGVTVALITGVDPIDGTKLRTSESGDTATFSVVLNALPQGEVSMTVESSVPSEGKVSPELLTFTELNWNAPQIVTVTGQSDHIADGDQPYEIVLSVPMGTDPNYVVLRETHVQASNVDHDKPGFTLTLVDGTDPKDKTKLVTSEAGTTATFTLALNSQPKDSVTIELLSSRETEGTVAPASLTFTKTDWESPKKVSVTGVSDQIQDGNAVFFIRTQPATSTDEAYALLDPPDVQVTNLDNDTADVRIALGDGQDPSNPGKLFTDESGGTATFTVWLTSKPTAEVTVPLSSSNTKEGKIWKSSLTFTQLDYSAPQSVTITGVGDGHVVDGNQPYLIAIAAASSKDANYNGKFGNQVQVINRDLDSANVIVKPTSGLITGEDGSSASFTIRLQSRPTGDVTIPVSSSKPLEGQPDVSSVTFTPDNWDMDQTVTVTGIWDSVQDGNQTYKILVGKPTSSDGNYQGKPDPDDVSLTNNDIDTAGFKVTPTAGLMTTEAGGKATFTIALNSKPVSPNATPPTVRIQLSSSKPTEGGVSPASVTFTATDWATPQTVTVTGTDDKIADGDQPYLIVLGLASSVDANYNAHKPDDVLVTNQDDDIPGLDIVAAQALKTFEKNAGTATFTVALKSQPAASVSIGVSSSNMNEGTVSPATLVFSAVNWSTPQRVTITGVQDDVADGPQAYQVKLANAVSSGDPNYDGKFATQLDVQNIDDDVMGFVVSAGSMLQTSEKGDKATFSVALRSKPAGTASVTLPLSSSNTQEGTVSPTSLQFTGSNWNQPHTVTVTGVDDQIADGDVSYQIAFGAPSSADAAYANLSPPAAVTLTNVNDDQVGVQVLSTSCATTPGTSATFTLLLTSQPSANVTISLISDTLSSGTVAPDSVTFSSATGPGGWDTPQTVTVTGAAGGTAGSTVAYKIITGNASAPGETTGYDGYSNVADVACTNSTP